MHRGLTQLGLLCQVIDVIPYAKDKLRKEKSGEILLRMLLIHLNCGRLQRETVVQECQANLADVFGRALPMRLHESSDWL